MNKSDISKKGGLARIHLYGNPGTVAGRRLGGLNSVAIQNKVPTGFKLLRPIVFPRESVKLAELLGILAGDGHVGKYQVMMTTSSISDLEHAQYTKELFEQLFNIPVSVIRRKDKNAIVIVVSSKEVCRFLVRKGLIQGNKVKMQLDIPNWIRSHDTYRQAFIRGLFDTDGCVYVDAHVIRNKHYRNIGMQFTNRSLPLLRAFKGGLEEVGLTPTQTTKFAVFLRREKDIWAYFRIFGSSNSKHLGKLEAYLISKRRGVRVVE